MIKKLAKLLIPRKIVFLTKSAIAYWYDIKRYAISSNTYYTLDNPNKIKGQLIVLYHIIEKGLTMPETRLGFGTKIIMNLLDLCNLYILRKYDKKNQIFVHSVKVLIEYLRYHEINNYSIDLNILKRISYISSETNIYDCSNQNQFTNKEFFKDHQSSFDRFCKSRHSSRCFTKDDIPIKTIYNCIELANSSPSACNRQPTRVYIIKNHQMILKVLELQTGNRGFGHMTNTLLVIASDISLFQGNERNESFLNAGLFSMTLIYSLHFYKIGACLLNWSSSNTNDKKLRTLLQIPNNEQISVLVACGFLPEKIKIACSPRLKASEISYEII